MAAGTDNALFLREIQREYLNIIDDGGDVGYYEKKILNMISSGGCRLIVNLNHLREKNETRTARLLGCANEELLAFQNAVKELVSTLNPTFSAKHEEFLVGFEGSFGERHVSPRTLKSRFLNNLVCCEGVVTKCSTVNPKLFRSAHYCPTTCKSFERRYTDLTSLEPFPSSSVYPVKDEAGNPLETEYGFCVFRDHQRITIQEMPEKSPPGLLPHSIDVLLNDELIDSCKPGDRVQVIGIYRCLPTKRSGFIAGSFRSILLANNVQTLSNDAAPLLSAVDIRNIKKLSNSKTGIFDLLSKSIAPSISGHEYIKKAILCMLIGGTERILENGTRLRGDINLLLVGDPSTAKSQLLRYVLHAAPRAICSTGRGSSGVGLTAAVTTDGDTGERRLEAGAMVLGDQGIVCIDEFDKMSDIDRTALHEVMEQGRVTIAKAGIHAQLNARCSVLAAANPVHGRYDEFQTPMQNIGFPDSLLSRFDLLFIVLDEVDVERDRRISDHVLRMRQYRAPNEQEGDPTILGSGVNYLSTENPDLDNEEEQSQVFEKLDTHLYGVTKREKFVSASFLKKYIYVAKQLKPVLSQEACEIICKAYSDLRDMAQSCAENARTLPVTARTLETLIRLSTAHAKARMSKSVDKKDAMAAVDLLHFAYFQRVREKPRRKKSRCETEAREDHESTDQENQQSDSEHHQPPPVNGDHQVSPQATPAKPEAALGVVHVSPERQSLFQTYLYNIFRDTNSASLELEYVCQSLSIMTPSGVQPFTEAEILCCTERMQRENKLMLSGDVIFLI